MDKKIIIAIDGPAASGKGTLARKLAQHFNLAYLDTGKLYRAFAFYMLEHPSQTIEGEVLTKQVHNFMNSFNLELLNDPSLTSDKVGNMASRFSKKKELRSALLEFQQNFARNPPSKFQGAILDGRDIGTIICPKAPLKIFMTASIEQRAKRRFKELQLRGDSIIYSDVLHNLQQRDKRDGNRDIAPMKIALDAHVIDSSHKSALEIFDQAKKLVSTILGL